MTRRPGGRSAGGAKPVDPAVARAAMVERLQADGVLRSPAVVAAMGAVPRHRFLDDVDGAAVGVGAAYADTAVMTRTTASGVPISSVSQPTIVAVMLELAAPAPGQRVLEIGTGSGYNAALLAAIVAPDVAATGSPTDPVALPGPQGDHGRVVSIELEADLAEAARRRLRSLGIGGVEIVVGDGAAGHPPGAPYDRIVVTAGVDAAPPALVDQLVVGGRLVVPIVGPDGIGAIHLMIKRVDGLDDVTSVPCGFLLLRSPAEPVDPDGRPPAQR